MNFKERDKPDTKITVLQPRIPYVLIHTRALQKMFMYTEQCNDEIGWLGTAVRDGNEIQITDVFLFSQEVHATTTEITPEGLSSFAEELLQRPDGMEVWNNIRVWGHSHVRMPVNPSQQDEKQMEEFSNIGQEWFVRVICNKVGEFCVDVFDYNEHIIYKNTPWERLLSVEEEQIQLQIEQLKAQLKLQSEGGIQDLATDIKQEMSVKVQKKTYTRPTIPTTQRAIGTETKLGTTKVGAGGTISTGSGYDYANSFGRYIGAKWTMWKNVPPTLREMEMYEDVIPDEYSIYNKDIYSDGKKKEGFFLIHEDEDVYKFFSPDELLEIAFCKTIDNVKDEMELYGYQDAFSDESLSLIYKIAIDEANKVGWGSTLK